MAFSVENMPFWYTNLHVKQQFAVRFEQAARRGAASGTTPSLHSSRLCISTLYNLHCALKSCAQLQYYLERNGGIMSYWRKKNIRKLYNVSK